MKKKWTMITLSLALSTGVLAACNLDNNDRNEGPADVNYNPTRYNDNYPDNLDERDRPFIDEQDIAPGDEGPVQRRDRYVQ
ncbi:hypothetical protein [Halobacillus massiliensis]|uniref:hypothetical protein n=1 Tax=Halobacillus massiliensis TaxID=1926286 RepID=UPI0009E3BB5D|nr:hypothetical protein [Halobacillus massiliensis]